jgi:hypothetical protein
MGHAIGRVEDFGVCGGGRKVGESGSSGRQTRSRIKDVQSSFGSRVACHEKVSSGDDFFNELCLARCGSCVGECRNPLTWFAWSVLQLSTV